MHIVLSGSRLAAASMAQTQSSIAIGFRLACSGIEPNLIARSNEKHPTRMDAWTSNKTVRIRSALRAGGMRNNFENTLTLVIFLAVAVKWRRAAITIYGTVGSAKTSGRYLR